MKTSSVTDALLGIACGDALGVPFEFKTRLEMDFAPATGMVGYGTYHQPAGTWSDDSSLTFCLAESLLSGYDLRDIATRFVDWRKGGQWTARGAVFDIGITTSAAIERLEQILKKGGLPEIRRQINYGTPNENGNGALMRILPLGWLLIGKEIREQFEIVKEVSALTHRHIRSALACLIYLNMADKIRQGLDKDQSYSQTRDEILDFWNLAGIEKSEQLQFNRIIAADIREINRDAIRSDGYVVHSLEAAFWCFLRENNFEDTILTAVNLGSDTDTTAAITGGLAGMYYGSENIPQSWLAPLARREDILELGQKLQKKYG